MKKYITLIISILVLILSFTKSWYSDFLFDKLFIFYIISNFILFVMFIFCFITSLRKMTSKYELINILSIIILLISVLLFIFFPFRKIKVNYELNKYEKARLEIVDKIILGELKADDLGNIKLPNKYRK